MKILDELGVATLWDKIKSLVNLSVFNPDEEDLISVESSEGTKVMKIADRSYSPSTFSGKGYKILRKNIQKVSLAVANISVNTPPSSDGYVSFIINGIETNVDLVASTDSTTALVAEKIANKLAETMTEYEVSSSASSVTLTRKFGGTVLSASSFSANSTGSSCTISDTTKSERRNLITSSMMNNPNTIYEIRYDFDLNGETIEIPEGCTLKFEGGSLRNGTVKGNNTNISSKNYKIFSLTLKGCGTFSNKYFYTEWYGARGDNNTDCSKSIDKSIMFPIGTICFSSGIYNISETIECIDKNIIISKDAIINVTKQIEAAIRSYIPNLNFYKEISEIRSISGGGLIKCNNLSEKGIYIYYANMIDISNIAIKDCKIGIHTSNNGSVAFIKDIRLTNTTIVKDSIGLKIEGNDSQFKNVTPVNFHIGVENIGTGNSYAHIKPWISFSDLWEDSIAFNCKANDGVFIDCRCDTMQYAIGNSVSSNRSCFYGLSLILNQNVVSNDIYTKYPKTLIKKEEKFGDDSLTLLGLINLAGYNINANKKTSLIYVNGEPFHNSLGYLPLNKYNNGEEAYSENTFGVISDGNNSNIAFWNGKKWKDSNGIDIDLKTSETINENDVSIDNRGFRYLKNYKERIFTGEKWNSINLSITAFVLEDKIYKALRINTYYNKSVMIKISTRLSESLFLISARRTEKGIFAYPLYQVGLIGSKYDAFPIFYYINDSDDFYDIYIKAPTDSVIDIYPYNYNRQEIYNQFVDGVPERANQMIVLSQHLESLPNLPTNANLYIYNKKYKKICIWTGIKWIDTNGFNPKYGNRGESTNRPSITSDDEGFEYYDTTLKKKILWNGSAWVNMDGTSLK